MPWTHLIRKEIKSVVYTSALCQRDVVCGQDAPPPGGGRNTPPPVPANNIPAAEASHLELKSATTPQLTGLLDICSGWGKLDNQRPTNPTAEKKNRKTRKLKKKSSKLKADIRYPDASPNHHQQIQPKWFQDSGFPFCKRFQHRLSVFVCECACAHCVLSLCSCTWSW